MTQAARLTEQAVAARFAGTRFGRYNRRPIAGTNIWSQHSWDNARDIFPPEPYGLRTKNDHTPGPYLDYLDEVHEWLLDNRNQLGIKGILWRVTDHWNHVHVDLWPTGTGTPPFLQTGTGDFRHKNGTRETAANLEVKPDGTFTNYDDSSLNDPPLPIGEDMFVKKGDKGEQVKFWQLRLLRFDPACLPQWGADGSYGDEMVAAVKKVVPPSNGLQVFAVEAEKLLALPGPKGATGATGPAGPAGPKGKCEVFVDGKQVA